MGHVYHEKRSEATYRSRRPEPENLRTRDVARNQTNLKLVDSPDRQILD